MHGVTAGVGCGVAPGPHPRPLSRKRERGEMRDLHATAGLRNPAHPRSDRRGEGLVQVLEDVVDVLDADRQAHHVLAYAGTLQFLG